ncbi:hypothetical protein Vadar_017077 [Vaccinium darrowii]|uniref:Uncharacterized protein n=1 Tax=Vaccinium darrowii TaxID=229202 RepID=A0ACB7YX36_9ERIC|nr:hypothetical protein Vadar_017077 [Vaccinium darrowii]
MEVLVLVLIMANALHSSATWCICKDGMGDASLQKTLDYACGAGADCTLIHQNGACYSPNTVRAHCSYAVNSYFQKKGQAQGSCDFSGTASVTTSDPSSTGCVYPASARNGRKGEENGQEGLRKFLFHQVIVEEEEEEVEEFEEEEFEDIIGGS